VLQSKGLDRP